MKLPSDFLTLSRRVGSDPLLVQGPGGNTSIKIDGVMWIKASGTLLAEAETSDIFVGVDAERACAELDGAGDGDCRAALIDASATLRPSIETTFHAMFDAPVVFHYHSVASICHAISQQGREALGQKLHGLAWARAPYRKPGIPLTRAIRDTVGTRQVQVVVLDNHGVIVVGDTVGEVEAVIDDVEDRLKLPPNIGLSSDGDREIGGWSRVDQVSGLAHDTKMCERAVAGSYYPDHVVFLGPALPVHTAEEIAERPPDDFAFPATIVKCNGVFIKNDSTPAQRAMLQCLYDVLSRTPSDWALDPIGKDAEAELLNWDAEKYRQMLAKRR